MGLPRQGKTRCAQVEGQLVMLPLPRGEGWGEGAGGGRLNASPNKL